MPETFGQKIRRYRKAQGLTQAELAQETGLSQSSICYLEHSGRHPSRNTSILLADYLGIELKKTEYAGNDFAIRLTRLRHKKGVSVAKMSEKLGINTQRIHAWERDVCLPSLDNAICLADYFDVSLDELVGREWPRADHSPARR